MRMSEWDGLPQSPDDQRRKFNGTYILAKIQEFGEDPCPVYVSTDEERGELFVLGRKRKPGDGGRGPRTGLYYSSRLTGADIDVIEAIPTITGVIPYGRTVQLFRRLPARQWQVGLCAANGVVWDETLHNKRLDIDVVTELFLPKYEPISVHEAHARFRDPHQLAIAINNRYWLKRVNKEICLYRHHLLLGTFLMGKLFMQQSCLDLRQELKDDLQLEV